MTTAARDADRRDAVRYSEAATQLRTFARGYTASVAEVTVDPALHTFGPTVAAKLRNTYEDLAVYLTLAAEQAEELAAQYRERLGVSA